MANALDRRLDEIELDQLLDRGRETSPDLDRLRALAAVAGIARDQPRILSIEARRAFDRGDFAASARLHVATYRAARAVRDPVVAAEAAANLVLDLGYFQDQTDRAGDWAGVAQAEEAALPGTRAAATVERAVGVLDAKRGRIEDAARHFRAAVAILRRAVGPDHPAYAQALGSLGNALGDLGRPDEAIALHHQEIGILERWAGRDALALARPLMNVALDESDAGRHDAAAADARRAVALQTGHHASDDSIGNAQLNLGSVLINGGHAADAIAPLEEARDRFTRAGELGVAGQCGADLAIARGHLWSIPTTRSPGPRSPTSTARFATRPRPGAPTTRRSSTRRRRAP